MMPGSLSIEKRTAGWNRAAAEAYIVAAAVGVLAGIAVTYGRMPLQLPGHKVFFWMIPVLAVRLRGGTWAGAATGAFAAAITTMSLGGRIAGGAMMLPTVTAAGVILDLAVHWTERRNYSKGGTLIVLALAGMAGNLICFANRLVALPGAVFTHGRFTDLLIAAGSYAFFGFAAAFLGAAMILIWPWRRSGSRLL